MTPYIVKQNEVASLWPIFLPGLHAVIQTDPNVGWTPLGVLDALLKQNAYAVVLTADQTQAGFFMGYPQADGAFFIWIAHLERGYDLGEGIQHVKDFAKKLGCNRIIFGTNRRGWDRVARKHGFRPTYWEQNI